MTFEQYTKKYDELHTAKESLLCVMIDLIHAGNYEGMEIIKNGEYERVWQKIEKLNDEYFNQYE